MSSGTTLGTKQPVNQKKPGYISPSPSNNNFMQTQSMSNLLNKGQKQVEGRPMLPKESRNCANTSTQKSVKSVNSHAKYLSGGNDQYQKILQTNVFVTTDSQRNKQEFSSHKKAEFRNPVNPQFQEQDVLTGEDCDDGVIADERFASPDNFTTEDFGRPSLHKQEVQPILMTLSENDPTMNKMLSQYTNYEEIKKHLEMCIAEEKEDMAKGYNRNQMAQSAMTSQGDTQNNSRNGTAQKHFESLKQKIRGVFEQATHNMPSEKSTVLNSSKTPIKNQGRSNAKNQQSSLTQKNQAQNNGNKRMSLEAKEQVNRVDGHSKMQGCLSSTAAGGRALSFSQTGFLQGGENYKSSLNQRKGSNLIAK
mmetsp:Transcript_39579/g.38092  ORF Transcript_39579/g.38092 Transcript_39579/m.38092 type:complete len:363 (-) Transcript_39579:438-1526(-)